MLPYATQRAIAAVGVYVTGTNSITQHDHESGGSTAHHVSIYSVVHGGAMPPGATVATAPPTPVPPTMTPFHVSPNTTATVTAAAVPEVNGLMAYAWSIYPASVPQHAASGRYLPSPDDVVELNLTATGDWYASFGLSPQLMDGPMVACYVDPATGAPHCSDWDGVGLTIRPRTPFTKIANSARLPDGRGWTVTLRGRAHDFNVDMSGRPQRAIFATGAYKGTVPLQPAATDFSARVINMAEGFIPGENTRRGFWAGVTVTAIVGVVSLEVATLVSRLAAVGSRVALAWQAFVMVAFVGLLGLFTGLNARDHQKNLAAHPGALAFGDGAVFCLWFVLSQCPRS